MFNLLTLIGILGTIIYSGSLYWLSNDRLGQLNTMTLNELGDFLAGIFGPLAIFWLILGFFQQGKELQQSTMALKLQAKELNNSVHQQSELVEVSRQQMETERESLKIERQRQLDLAKPNFVFFGIGGKHRGTGISNFKTIIKNTGGTVTQLSLATDGNIKIEPENIPALESNREYSISWNYTKGESDDKVNFSITSTDSLGNRGNEVFIIETNNIGENPYPKIYKKG